MQEYWYSQVIVYYKVNFENLKKQNNNMFFEQDETSSYTSKKNKELIRKIIW